eukprot:1160272-Pelagomonas_calceolata.AAC.5
MNGATIELHAPLQTCLPRPDQAMATLMHPDASTTYNIHTAPTLQITPLSSAPELASRILRVFRSRCNTCKCRQTNKMTSIRSSESPREFTRRYGAS